MARPVIQPNGQAAAQPAARAEHQTYPMPAHHLSTQGFAVVRDVLAPDECEEIVASIHNAPSASVGTRSLLAHGWCKALAGRLRAHPKLAPLLPAGFVATQCTFFTKSSSRNWLVPIHQDLSIPVAERVDSPHLHGWSEKEGALFVQPPIELLEQLIAVRLHLDPCGLADGPLQLVPGSHLHGRVVPEAAVAARHTQETVSCTLERGDVLLMRPLLLHASSKASGTSLRRVLHFLFGPRDLPCGLRWQDAV